MREVMDPTVCEAVLDTDEFERHERYRRRRDCLALAVELFAGSGSPSAPEAASAAALEAAADFERWLMEPFQEQDNAEDDDE